ncbi:MAG: MFS transporter [Spirochaetaceae bacterium]|jgi:MFS family permease|nr:MFS transporter [Spirochaetaceae bacterium]
MPEKKNDQTNSMRTVAIVTLLGGTVEWYCFLLFGLASGLVNARLFTDPNWTDYTKQSVAWIIFALGYIARPFGAMFFGNTGDKLGRKFTVIASLMFMGVSTFIIGCLPVFESAGIWAIVLLQFFRLTQCFGLGGKWGGGILMAFENADPKKRGFYAAIPQAGLPVGLALAGLFCYIPYKFWGDSFWTIGWRIPFWAAIVLVFLIMYIRLNIMETKDFQQAQRKAAEKEAEEKKTAVPLKEMFRKYWKTILLGIGTRWVDGTMYNVAAVWSLSYLTRKVGLDTGTSLLINIAFAVCGVPMIFLAGKLADKWGKVKVYMTGAILCAVWAVPGLYVIECFGKNIIITLMVIILGWSIFYAGIWGTLGSLWAQLFETEVRYSGISFVYHAPSVFVAGIVPFIANFLSHKADGGTLYIGIFTAFVCIVSAWCGYVLQKRHDEGR